MTGPLRLFVCTWLSRDNQGIYAERTAALIALSGGTLRAIPNGSAHVTHAFLPRADDGQLDAITQAVRDVAARHASVAIRLGQPAILYARAEARLVYAPIVHGAEQVTALGAAIVGELRACLPDLEVSGSHSPHVTLARFRKQTRRGAARPVSDAIARSEAGACDDRVAEIHLVSSVLASSEPRYVSLFRATLE